jgi:hypothetical protein
VGRGYGDAVRGAPHAGSKALWQGRRVQRDGRASEREKGKTEKFHSFLVICGAHIGSNRADDGSDDRITCRGLSLILPKGW